MNYVLSVLSAGNPYPVLFDGNYDQCMYLAHAVEQFPKDVVRLEVWNEDTGETSYKWQSAHWN